MQLDHRSQNQLTPAKSVTTFWVRKSVWSRLLAEWRLYKRCGTEDTVLCFNGLPPLFRLRGKVVVFIQNRILLESDSLASYSVFLRIRLRIERVWMRLAFKNVDRYIVQTNSMKNAAHRCLGNKIAVSILPFSAPAPKCTSEQALQPERKYDFAYAANGEAHKNHNNLLEAWRLLSEAGLKPSLALTVSTRDFPFLSSHITKYREDYELKIVNLERISTLEMRALYKSSSALIFPSITESLGLPLIEAQQFGIPILAPELDYVRDVVEPIETFDPHSPISIARAVKRFLDQPEPTAKIHSAEEFLSEILR